MSICEDYWTLFLCLEYIAGVGKRDLDDGDLRRNGEILRRS